MQEKEVSPRILCQLVFQQVIDYRVLFAGVFSKGAKALRECETEITTLKEAMALKGVGKGIAGYVMEMINTGVITKLEEIRAGYA